MERISRAISSSWTSTRSGCFILLFWGLLLICFLISLVNCNFTSTLSMHYLFAYGPLSSTSTGRDTSQNYRSSGVSLVKRSTKKTGILDIFIKFYLHFRLLTYLFWFTWNGQTRYSFLLVSTWLNIHPFIHSQLYFLSLKF